MSRTYSRKFGYFDSRDDKKRNIGCHVKLPFPDGEHNQTWYSFSRDSQGPTRAQLSLRTKPAGHLADDTTLEELMNAIAEMEGLEKLARPIDRMRAVFQRWEDKGFAKKDDASDDIARLSLNHSEKSNSGHAGDRSDSSENPPKAPAPRRRSRSRSVQAGPASTTEPKQNPKKGTGLWAKNWDYEENLEPRKDKPTKTETDRERRHRAREKKAGGSR